jgi:hypothetical protein
MVIERINDEIVVRVPAYIDMEDVQRFIDLIKFKEAKANTQATDEDINNLVKEVKKGWWEANRSRFIH